MCTPFWGAHEALAFGGDVGIGCQRPGRRVRPAAAAQRAATRGPHPSITGAGSISASISATASARAFGAIPSIPAAGRPAISTCGSRPTRLCLAPRRISTAPGSMARSPAHFVVLGRNARPRTSGFRLCADGSVTLLIGYCSMAPRAAHLAMLHWGQGGSFQHSLHREPDRENRISLLEARECHLHQPDRMR